MTAETGTSHVYFDATYLHYGAEQRGIAQVVCQLVRMILEDPRLSEIRFIATAGQCERQLRGLGVPDGRMSYVATPPIIGRWARFHGAWVDFRYRHIVKNARFVFHPEYRTVLRSRHRQLVLYYDFIFLERDSYGQNRPGLRSLARRGYLALLHAKLRRAATAEFAIAISTATKEAATRHLQRGKSQSIKVMHLGVRDALSGAGSQEHPPNDDARVHFLFVGGIADHRKNLRALLRHFHEVFKTDVSQLHIVGSMPTHQATGLRNEVCDLGLSDTAVLHGKATDSQLSDLYQRCHFLLFPSLSEGFGLPLVEAMRNGVVPCAFRNSSIPEVIGNAGILAEDNDFAAWGKAIGQATVGSEAYCQLQRNGRERAATFSEEAMFARYGDYFAEIIAQSRL